MKLTIYYEPFFEQVIHYIGHYKTMNIVSKLRNIYLEETRNKYSSDCSLIDASYISNPISLSKATKSIS